jgi:hypothetical protein
MTPSENDALAEKLVELMLRSWPREEGPVEAMLRRRAGRIHLAGHSVMTQILGVAPDASPFDWPLSCTKKRDISIEGAVTEAQPCTMARGELERDVLICLAGVAAETIDSPGEIDQPRARLERAAALAHLHCVEGNEKVAHYWMAYLFELAVRELSNVWDEVERRERCLRPTETAVTLQKLEPHVIRETGPPSLPMRVVVEEPAARIVPPPSFEDTPADPRQRNAGYIDDGVLDSRLRVLGVPARYVKSLGDAGVVTVRDLISLRLPEMEQMRGIGERGALTIAAALNAERYTYMPGDFPERWRRYLPGSDEEAAPAWETDPSAPIESLGLERPLARALSRRNNIHCVRDLLARSEFDLLARKPGVSQRQLAAIEQAMLARGYVLVGSPIRRRWQRGENAAGADESNWFPMPSDPYGPLEMLSVPDPVIQALHSAQLYTIADLLATSEPYFQRLGLDARRIAQVTKAMDRKGYVLLGVPGKRRFVPVKK